MVNLLQGDASYHGGNPSVVTIFARQQIPNTNKPKKSQVSLGIVHRHPRAVEMGVQVGGFRL